MRIKQWQISVWEGGACSIQFLALEIAPRLLSCSKTFPELALLHSLLMMNACLHRKNTVVLGFACLARELIKDATWQLVKRFVRAGTWCSLTRENIYPCLCLCHVVLRRSVQRVQTTFGLLLPRSPESTHLITLHLICIKETTSRDHTGSLRFSALAGCHLHQTAGLSLPSRHHGIRTHTPTLSGHPPGRQYSITVFTWSLGVTFNTQYSIARS
jgi:hypothetical protein